MNFFLTTATSEISDFLCDTLVNFDQKMLVYVKFAESEKMYTNLSVDVENNQIIIARIAWSSFLAQYLIDFHDRCN